MKKEQSLNFLWLNLDLPAHPDPESGYISNPIPGEYIENIRKSAKINPNADISLWVDSKRLTPLQYSWLKASITPVELQDLRSIPEYNNEDLYNHGEENPYWRNVKKDTTIWRQVDAAKILVALQGNYSQSFFLDLDYAHIKLDTPEIQQRLNDYGFLIGQRTYKPLIVNGVEQHSESILENQFFGITGKSKEIFTDLYKDTLVESYKGNNGWRIFKAKFKDIVAEMKKPQEDIAYDIRPDGSQAYHPNTPITDGNRDSYTFEQSQLYKPQIKL